MPTCRFVISVNAVCTALFSIVSVLLLVHISIFGPKPTNYYTLQFSTKIYIEHFILIEEGTRGVCIYGINPEIYTTHIFHRTLQEHLFSIYNQENQEDLPNLGNGEHLSN